MRYCSRECYRAARAVSETKRCQECGDLIERPPSYPQQNWETRRYCSRACWAKVKSRVAADGKIKRTCPICGDEYAQRYPKQQTCRSEACKTSLPPHGRRRSDG
jgi:hypothetical protein